MLQEVFKLCYAKLSEVVGISRHFKTKNEGTQHFRVLTTPLSMCRVKHEIHLLFDAAPGVSPILVCHDLFLWRNLYNSTQNAGKQYMKISCISFEIVMIGRGDNHGFFKKF